MKELELKYGCNPNQKPSRIFMEGDAELPITVLNGRPGYINLLDAFNSWQLVKEFRLVQFFLLPVAKTCRYICLFRFLLICHQLIKAIIHFCYSKE